MDSVVLWTVEQQLEDDFNRLQLSTGAAIPTSVRVLIREVVLESLEMRGHEWQQRGLDPNTSFNSTSIANEISNAMNSILTGADTYIPPVSLVPTPPPKRIMLIGVIKKIHENFCGIFPFCR